MFQRKNSLAALVVIGLLSGCGGGNSTSGSSVAAFIPGVYRTIYNCNSTANGTLIDGSDNMYQACGTKLSVGKLSGTIASSATGYGSIKFTVFDSGPPASTVTLQLPSGPVTVPVPAGKPTVSTSDLFTGSLFTSSDNRVVELYLQDAPGPSYKVNFNSKWVGASPVGSITTSYSTMSGNYIAYLAEKIPTETSDPTQTLSISTGGIISGTTNLGSVSGQISKFNSTSGVHDVSITLTPPSGLPVVMTGVIGPYDVNRTGLVQNVRYSGLLLAVSGGGAGFYKVFVHF